MHKCEFCFATFNPRPQVKNPRACNKEDCQMKRQRANEQDWHRQHSYNRDKQYHKIRRQQRKANLLHIIDVILECLRVGKELLGKRVEIERFRPSFQEFILELGIRNTNKFWIPENSNQFG